MTGRRRLSIKARVTLWFTLMMTALMLLMLLLLFRGVGRAAQSYHEELLTQAMATASDAVRVEGDIPRLRMDRVEDFGKVSFALLDERGSLWQGRWPPFALVPVDGAVRRAQGTNGAAYLTQDLLLPLSCGPVWLRGYLVLDTLGFLEQAASWRLMLLLPLLILLAAGGGYLLTRRAFRPVKEMSHQAEGVLDGRDLSLRFPEGADELGRLGRSMNGMIGRLSDSFERERRFTDDASHELRTPLTVIRTACDFALSQGEESEYREALQTIASKAEEMNALVNQLLHLARMEGGRIVLQRERVDFSSLCLGAAAESVRDKVLDTAGVAQQVWVSGDELLLMRLVILLTDNASRYASSRVALTLTEQAGQAVLRVSDDGPGIPPELRERVFDRFFQADGARSADSSGAGLGLTMAREIAALHGGSVAVAPEGPGATLELRLPLQCPNATA